MHAPCWFGLLGLLGLRALHDRGRRAAVLVHRDPPAAISNLEISKYKGQRCIFGLGISNRTACSVHLSQTRPTARIARREPTLRRGLGGEGTPCMHALHGMAWHRRAGAGAGGDGGRRTGSARGRADPSETHAIGPETTSVRRHDSPLPAHRRRALCDPPCLRDEYSAAGAGVPRAADASRRLRVRRRATRSASDFLLPVCQIVSTREATLHCLRRVSISRQMSRRGLSAPSASAACGRRRRATRVPRRRAARRARPSSRPAVQPSSCLDRAPGTREPSGPSAVALPASSPLRRSPECTGAHPCAKAVGEVTADTGTGTQPCSRASRDYRGWLAGSQAPALADATTPRHPGPALGRVAQSHPAAAARDVR